MTNKTIEFLNKLNKRYDNDYLVLGEYINQNTKIKVKHLKCNQEYEINPKQFLAKRSKGCTYCRIKERTKTHETFLKEVYSLVEDEYTVLSKYISSNQKIKIRHNICKHEYEVLPTKFLNGRRCPNCFGKNKKTTDKWKKEVNELSNGEYSVIGEYVNNRTKIDMKHNICGHK